VYIVGAAVLIAGAVSGCVPVIGAVTLGDLFTGTSLVATGLTGKSLSDDALSAMTGKDCSVMDAALEKDRKICEADGSKATAGDFNGLIGISGSNPAAPQATAAAQVSVSPPQAPATPYTPIGVQPQPPATAVAFTSTSPWRGAN
jgi:hypothetical protein